MTTWILCKNAWHDESLQRWFEAPAIYRVPGYLGPKDSLYLDYTPKPGDSINRAEKDFLEVISLHETQFEAQETMTLAGRKKQ